MGLAVQDTMFSNWKARFIFSRGQIGYVKRLCIFTLGKAV